MAFGGHHCWMPSSSDLTAAVRDAAVGDEDAFRLLHRALNPGLIRYLWAHTGDAAEELAAETWLRVAHDLPRFSGDEAAFRGWVTTIARRRMRDRLRRRGGQPADGRSAGMLAVDGSEEAAVEALSTAIGLEVIARLPTPQAEAVLLTVVMELDPQTAGRVAGKCADAIRVAALWGLRRLAREFGQVTRLAHSGEALDYLIETVAPH